MLKKSLHLCFVFMSLLAAPAFGGREAEPKEENAKGKDPKTLEIEALEDAIALSANFLAKMTTPSGQFIYRIHLDPEINLGAKYNILRHAGTIYSMALYHEIHPEDREVRLALERAGLFLLKRSVGSLQGNEEWSAIWSRPEMNHSGVPLNAKLGGTGLGLVALLRAEKIKPGMVPEEELRRLGRFLVFMQKDDGSFYSCFDPAVNKGRSDQWQSLYYPGEAALGLAMLYERDRDELWLSASLKALRFLAESRRGAARVPADHWALLATGKLFEVGKGEEALAQSRDALTSHALQICRSMIAEQVVDPANPLLDGGFARDGRTTPAATRLEGLQAVLGFLPRDHGSRAKIEIAVDRGIAFLLRAQVLKGEFAGAMPRATQKMPSGQPGAGDFNRRVREVRIDYVQHAMSAMIQYLRRMKDER